MVKKLPQPLRNLLERDLIQNLCPKRRIDKFPHLKNYFTDKYRELYVVPVPV